MEQVSILKGVMCLNSHMCSFEILQYDTHSCYLHGLSPKQERIPDNGAQACQVSLR
jgi:hypothetical protein